MYQYKIKRITKNFDYYQNLSNESLIVYYFVPILNTKKMR